MIHRKQARNEKLQVTQTRSKFDPNKARMAKNGTTSKTEKLKIEVLEGHLLKLSLDVNHVIQEANHVTLEMEANPAIASKTVNHQKRQSQVQVVRPDIKTASARIHAAKIKHIRARL